MSSVRENLDTTLFDPLHVQRGQTERGADHLIHRLLRKPHEGFLKLIKRNADEKIDGNRLICRWVSFWTIPTRISPVAISK